MKDRGDTMGILGDTMGILHGTMGILLANLVLSYPQFQSSTGTDTMHLS